MAIMKQYKQGDLPENLYGNEKSKQGDSKINVKKPATGLPADDYSETDVNAGRKAKNTVDAQVFKLADEKDY
tara:strand:- start:526 stop:741 length:216 start_codon:yes stop_codon:yes gene_type:complete